MPWGPSSGNRVRCEPVPRSGSRHDGVFGHVRAGRQMLQGRQGTPLPVRGGQLPCTRSPGLFGVRSCIPARSTKVSAPDGAARLRFRAACVQTGRCRNSEDGRAPFRPDRHRRRKAWTNGMRRNRPPRKRKPGSARCRRSSRTRFSSRPPPPDGRRPDRDRGAGGHRSAGAVGDGQELHLFAEVGRWCCHRRIHRSGVGGFLRRSCG